MLNRRRLLQSMMAMPLLQGLRGMASAQPTACPSAGTDQKPGDGGPVKNPTLIVLFHGPFAFLEYSDRIEAITPSIDGHLYGAGNWKTEINLPQGTYYLVFKDQSGTRLLPSNRKTSAARTGQKSLGSDDHIEITPNIISDIDPDEESYCRFVLPPTDYIVALALMERSAQTPIGQTLGMSLFTGKHAQIASAVNFLGTTHALVYSLCQGTPAPNCTQLIPSLLNFPWVPVSNANNLGSTNLHIFAQPVFELGQDHSVNAFHRLVKLLPGLSIDLHRQTPPIMVQYDSPTSSVLDGVTAEEQDRLRPAPLQPNGDRKPNTSSFKPPVLCDAPSLFVTGLS